MSAKDGQAAGPAAAQPGDLLAEARAFHQAGKLLEAERLYKRVLADNPKDAGVMSKLGAALAGQGKLVEAAAQLERALEIDSDLIEALNNVGIVYQFQGKPEHATRVYRRAIDIDPGHLSAHVNLGALLHGQDRHEDARQAYERALAIDPGFAEAHNGLGAALAGLGRSADAARAFRRAVELDPGHGEALNNLGNMLKLEDDIEGAIDCYRRAIAAKPRAAQAHVNLGNALRVKGQLGDALESLRHAVELDRGLAEAHWNLSHVLLLQGKLAEAWPEYEWRAQCREFRAQTWNHGRPRWEGRPLAAKTILLYAEQGIGDAIQFVRYASLVAERVRGVLVKCPQPLARLFRTVAGVRNAGPDMDTRMRFHVEAPLMSLPGLFRTGPDSVPAAVPYLAPPAEGPSFDFPADASGGLRVGIAWAGNPRHTNDRNRSVALGLLAPLLDIEGCRFASLQVGARAGDVAAHGLSGRVVDFGAKVQDFADTARAMQALDLVISVDTAVAHLAGALGRPVWTLLPFAPDWRWFGDGDATPWYPTMRLYRQRTAGDWPDVVARVAADLRARRAH